MWKILVIEDSLANQQLIAEVLSDKAKCHFANNGREGFRAYKGSVERGDLYDVILLDMAMPIVDGLKFLTLLREDELYFGTARVIVISQTAYKELALASMENGADDHVLKPLDPGILIDKIEKLLAGRKKRPVSVNREALEKMGEDIKS